MCVSKDLEEPLPVGVHDMRLSEANFIMFVVVLTTIQVGLVPISSKREAELVREFPSEH